MIAKRQIEIRVLDNEAPGPMKFNVHQNDTVDELRIRLLAKPEGILNKP